MTLAQAASSTVEEANRDWEMAEFQRNVQYYMNPSPFYGCYSGCRARYKYI